LAKTKKMHTISMSPKAISLIYFFKYNYKVLNCKLPIISI
jgi:hypothetical protein